MNYISFYFAQYLKDNTVICITVKVLPGGHKFKLTVKYPSERRKQIMNGILSVQKNEFEYAG